MGLGENENAEGNSLFLKKHNPQDESHIATFGVSASDFFSELALYLNEKFRDYEVLLRLNCEGVEDDVIYSTHNSFGNKLKLICGALKDVEELKGLEASEKLDQFIKENGLLFVKFSSGIYSWPKAHAAVLSLLEKKDGISARVVIEKPFGNNLASAKKLNLELSNLINEKQLSLVDPSIRRYLQTQMWQFFLIG